MRNYAVCFCYIFLLNLTVQHSAFAFADTEYKEMIASYPELIALDKNLNTAWTKLQQVSPVEAMKRYRESQNYWIDNRRNNLFNLHSDINTVASIINERTILLQELVRQHSDKNYLPKFTGKIEHGHNAVGGYSRFKPNNWLTGITICYYFEDEKIPAATKKLLTEYLEEEPSPTVVIRGYLEYPDSFMCDKRLSVSALGVRPPTPTPEKFGGAWATDPVLARLQKNAVRGSADAQYTLGNRYKNGHGVRGLSEAAEWYQKAADQGHAKAQFELGKMYMLGFGVPKDTQKAIELYQKAAEQGSSDAQFELGHRYLYGNGVPKDGYKAIELYQKAAIQGDAPSQRNLGYIYEDGDVVPKDENKAAEWFQKAADQGDYLAQFRLGAMYAEGRGVPQDEHRAVEWLQKAVNQEEYSNAKAQYYLGMMYAEGRGVLKDEGKAVELFQMAAEQDFTGNAQYYLGMMYAEGRGVLEDKQKATEWFQEATKRGHAGARSYLDKQNFLYKNLYINMPIGDVANLFKPYEIRRGHAPISIFGLGNPANQQEIIIFNEKELFIGKQWKKTLFFKGTGWLSEVSLMLLSDNYKENEIKELKINIIDIMKRNNFIPCFFDPSDDSISMIYKEIDIRLADSFLFLESETVKDLKIDLKIPGSLYDVLKKYPPNKRIVEFHYHPNEASFIVFKAYKDALSNVEKALNRKKSF